MATSSANPRKLRRYSEDGLELVRALRPQATAVEQAIRTLQSSGSTHVPTTQVHTQMKDLVRDWYHLDEFVGDVADGFFRADALRDDQRSGGPVLTFDDGMLGRLGRIGYADRDAAIAAARRSAEELDRLRRGRASRSDIQRFVAGIGRGQYDPAFATALAGQVGVRGLTDATALIRAAYSGSRTVPPEGIAAVRVLSNTVTTALDTLPDVPAGEHRDPGNRYLAAEDRLGAGFARDLWAAELPRSASGYPPTTEQDLSVLMRFADPPTAVALAVAGSRMTPRLAFRHQPEGDAANAWGAYGHDVTNYATMLGRNREAGARWLATGTNVEQVVARPSSADVDGGVALANLVEAGVSHPDETVRRPLMSRAVDAVGEVRAIRNPHLEGALATGVEHNMDLLGDRVDRTGWNGRAYAPDRGLTNTAIFLGELDRDPDARARVRAATDEYVRTVGAAGGGTADEARIGRVLGITHRAEAVADARNYYDFRAETESRLGKGADLVLELGKAPEAANQVIGITTGKTLGEHGAAWFVEAYGDYPTPEENRMAEETQGDAAARHGVESVRRGDADRAVGERGASDVYGTLGADPRFRDYVVGEE